MSHPDTMTLAQWTQIGFAFGVALAVMLVGSATGDDRLALSGIPLQPLIFAAGAVAALAVTSPAFVQRVAWLSHGLVALLAVTVLWSYQPDYGAWKLSNLLASSMLATFLFWYVIDRGGWRRFCQLWVVALLLLLTGALAYKSVEGFWHRDVLFLFNGPIVFARLMGIGAILSFVAFEGRWRHWLVLAFLLAVFWTLSNGPVLSILIALPILYWRTGDRSDRRVLMAVLSVATVGVLFAIYWLSLSIDLGRLALIVQLFSGGVGDLQDFASANSRLWGYIQTLKLIAADPWGVGLGGWRGSVVLGDLNYPHNLILELISEGGVFFGLIALLPFCAFFFGGHQGLVYCCLFLFLSQQFSGDLLDGRYLLCFATLCLMAVAQSKRSDSPAPALSPAAA